VAETKAAAILLAAGESHRMGLLKALLPWLGTNLISYQLAQMRAARFTPIVVVLGHDVERVARSLDPFPDLILAENPNYQMGKEGSIRVGIKALPE